MSRMGEHHQTLVDGVGKCSVPMWSGGMPGGFCDEPAYGKPPPTKYFYAAYGGERMRADGRYSGYVPALACRPHGGPDAPPTCDACGGINCPGADDSGRCQNKTAAGEVVDDE